MNKQPVSPFSKVLGFEADTDCQQFLNYFWSASRNGRMPKGEVTHITVGDMALAAYYWRAGILYAVEGKS